MHDNQGFNYMNACSGFPAKPPPQISLPDHLGLAGCNLSSAPHLAAVLLSGSLPPLDAFPGPLLAGPEAQGALPRWSKLSLATGPFPSLPSCYQPAITFPLFDFFFP